MEDSFPYYRDLHIDKGTKKLILNLLRSIRSVVPVAGLPDTSDTENDPEPYDPGYILNVLVLARKHSDELEGLFDPDELSRYAGYVSDYQEIMQQLEEILLEIKECRDSAMRFAAGMADMVTGIIPLTLTAEASQKDAKIVWKGQKNKLYKGDGIKLKIV